MSEIENIAKNMAEVLTSVIPDGYVLAFVIMPTKAEVGAEFMLGSVPSMVGGSDAIVSIFDVVSASHAESGVVRQEEFDVPNKH